MKHQIHRRSPLLIVIPLFFITIACSFSVRYGDHYLNVKRKSATYDSPITQQNFMLTGNENTVELGNLQVILSSTDSVDAQITLAEYDSRIHSEYGSRKESNAYTIENIPADFSGTVQVAFTIPDKIFNAVNSNDPNRKEDIVLWVGQQVFVPSTGETAFNIVPELAAVVDQSTKQIKTSITFENPTAPVGKHGSIGSHKTASLCPLLEIDTRRLTQDYVWAQTPKKLYFKVTLGWRWDSTRDGLFTYYFKSDKGSERSVGKIIDAVRASTEKLNEINFPINEPISIYVYDLDYREKLVFGEKKSPDGMWNFNPITRSRSISYHKKMLSGDEKVLLATVGHELMHFAQHIRIKHLFLPLSIGDPSSFYHLDEAIAVWFESFVLGDEDWIANVAEPQADFIHKPWWNSTGKTAGQYGYGASWLVEHIVELYGTDFINNAYREIFGNQAWITGVDTVSDFPFSEVFLYFLEDYFLEPAVFAKGLPNTLIFDQINNLNVMLEIDTLTSHDVYKTVNFQPMALVKKYETVNSTPGHLWIKNDKFDPEPVFTITKTLHSMNGYMLIFSFRGLDEEFKVDRGLTVSLTSEPAVDYVGIRVYGVQAGSDVSQAILIHDISPIKPGESKTIPHFRLGTGFDRIVLIFYNNNHLGFGKDGASPANIAATISYGRDISGEFSGDGFATSWDYPENYCYHKLHGCFPPYNPPACYYDYAPRGGGAGGNGEESKPCTNAAEEWCYPCGDCAGASDFVDYFRWTTPAFLINSIKIDNDGFVIDEDFSWLADCKDHITQLEQRADMYRLKCKLSDSAGELKGFFEIYGSIGTENENAGGGYWQAGHECIGVTVSGSWSVNRH